MANNFSAPKSRSLPTPTNVQDLSSTLTAWKSQLAPFVKNAAPVSTPVNFRVTSARGGLQLSWSPVAGADGYEILKSMNGSFTDDLVVIPISGANNSSYFDSLGGSSQSANYRVRTTSGTSNNPQSQRGPESGVVSHTSLDSADTKSATTTVLDSYTSDKTRAGARLGNYGAIQTSDAGSVASGSANSLASTASSVASPAASAGVGITFDKIASGANTAATMTVGQNASIVPDVNIPGIISATHVQGNLVSTATPSDGSVLAYSSADSQYDLPTNIFVNPSGSGDIVPANGNTAQSLGEAGSPWNVVARALNNILYVNAGDNLQTVLDTADAAGGGTVVVGPGTFVGPFTWPDSTSPIALIGSGIGNTILTVSGATTAVLSKGNSALPLGCRISDLTVDGNLQATYGLQLKKGKGWTIERIKVIRVTATTGEAIVLGESAVSSAEFYESRLLSISVAFESGSYVSGARPLNGLHLLQSASDNHIAFFVGWNMTNAGIVDDASDNRYVSCHVYGFPLLTYYPNYAMEVTGDSVITHLTSDGVNIAGVHVRGNRNIITNSRFQWGTGGTVSGAFPVLTSASVDYLNVSNNVIYQAKGISLGGVQSAVDFNGAATPIGANTTVFANVGIDDSGVALNLPNYLPGSQQFVVGAITPRGAVTAITPFNATPTLTLRKKTGQTAALLEVVDTNATTVLASIDKDGSFGSSIATTQSAGDNSTKIATTAYVDGAVGIVSGKLLKQTVVTNTATTSFTTQAGTKSARIRLVGAGGAGGFGSNNASGTTVGSGGGAGSYLEKILTLAGSTAYTIQIGTGGVGTTSSAPAGSATTFSDGVTTYTANGGSGGNRVSNADTTTRISLGGAGGAVSTNGDINAAGENGEMAFRFTGPTGTGLDGYAGRGGSALPYGSGGQSLNNATSTAGTAAIGFGSGGGGAISVNNGASRAGGNGANGILIVEEYS